MVATRHPAREYLLKYGIQIYLKYCLSREGVGVLIFCYQEKDNRFGM